jgi:hypothetical protein
VLLQEQTARGLLGGEEEESGTTTEGHSFSKHADHGREETDLMGCLHRGGGSDC